MKNRRKVYSAGVLIILVLIVWTFSDVNKPEDEFSERVKIAFRDAGNRLLLTNRDTTSLILPVLMLEKSKYQLAFERELSFLPDSLVTIVDHSFHKAKLPEYYRIEVLQCVDNEVAYSYEMSASVENTIIPCTSRTLPLNCYFIQVRFTHHPSTSFGNHNLFYLAIIILGIGLLVFAYNLKKKEIKAQENDKNYAKVGRFQFYPEQNKLVKEAVEINLSRKECELLAIFVAHPNVIIKRDELTKKVWEDNGVIVGRSLDTYISKLRKKLQDDETIKLVNVHGVGYKLQLLKT